MKKQAKRIIKNSFIMIFLAVVIIGGVVVVSGGVSAGGVFGGKEKEKGVAEVFIPPKYSNYTDKELTNEIFVKLISNTPDILGAETIFQVNNIFNTDLPIHTSFKKIRGNVKGITYYYWGDIRKSSGETTYNMTVGECFKGNNSCTSIKTPNGTIYKNYTVKEWIKTKTIPANYVGEMRVVGEYSQPAHGVNIMKVDWIPEIKIKEIGKEKIRKLKQMKWTWWDVNFLKKYNIFTNSSGNGTHLWEPVLLNLTGYNLSCPTENNFSSVRIIANDTIEIRWQYHSTNTSGEGWTIWADLNTTETTNANAQYDIYCDNSDSAEGGSTIYGVEEIADGVLDNAEFTLRWGIYPGQTNGTMTPITATSVGLAETEIYGNLINRSNPLNSYRAMNFSVNYTNQDYYVTYLYARHIATDQMFMTLGAFKTAGVQIATDRNAGMHSLKTVNVQERPLDTFQTIKAHYTDATDKYDVYISNDSTTYSIKKQVAPTAGVLNYGWIALYTAGALKESYYGDLFISDKNISIFRTKANYSIVFEGESESSRPEAQNVTLNQDEYAVGEVASLTYDYYQAGGNLEDTNLTLIDWFSAGRFLSERISYWSFNQNVTNDTENHIDNSYNDGVLNGTVWTSGKYSGAYEFDNQSSYIQIRDNPERMNFTSSFTVSAWIKPNLDVTEGTNTTHYIFGKEDNTDTPVGGVSVYGGYALIINKDEIRFDVSGKQHITTGNPLVNGSWQLVTAVFDDENDLVNIYFNGSLFDSFIEAGSITYDDELYTTIGARWNGAGAFNGVIDEVKVFNKSLTADEVLDVYNNEYMKTLEIEAGDFNNGDTLFGGVMAFDINLSDDAFVLSSGAQVWTDAVLTDCTAGNATVLFFDFGIEPTFNLTTGVDLDVRVNYTTATGSKGTSFNFSNVDNASICMFGKNLTIDLLVGEYKKSGYTQREIYIANHFINNITQNYTLYSLLNNASSGVDVSVQDAVQVKIEEALVKVQRFDYVNNTWRTVAWMYTGTEGTDHTYLEAYTALYRFLVYKNGVLLKAFDPLKVVSSDLVLQISEGVSSYYNYLETTTSSCTFDNTTKKLSCSVTDSSSRLTNTCLTIYENKTINTTYYYDCQAGDTGNWIVSLNSTNTAVYDYLIEGTYPNMNLVIERGTVDLLRNTNFGAVGLIGTAMVVIAGATMGLPVPALVVVLGALALWASVTLGFLSLTQATVFGIVLVAGILVWLMKR